MVYSTAGLLGGSALVAARPFRAPHHTVSSAGLIGGGPTVRPGEISLAHNGVLFLDELLEFPRHVLEMLRQPLEDRAVTIVRVRRGVTYPADFMLIAALNPCPCGHFGSAIRTCICSAAAITAYRSRLSGPLLDRIDLHVDVPALPYRELAQRGAGRIQRRHPRPRRGGARRGSRRAAQRCNARLSSTELRRVAPLDGAGTRAAGTRRRAPGPVGPRDHPRAPRGADHRRPGRQRRDRDRPPRRSPPVPRSRSTNDLTKERPMSSMKEKLKAVAGAIAAIEKQFGKGAIMPLSGGDIAEIGTIPTGSRRPRHRAGRRRPAARPRHRDLRPRIVGQDDADAARDRRGAEAPAACARSSTPSTRWTSATRASWACASRTCWCRSRITASRRWRSPTSWSARRAIDLIVIDSVAALVPKAEIEGEMGDAHMGLQARLMSQALRKLTAATARNNTAVVFINQLCKPEQKLTDPAVRARSRLRCVQGLFSRRFRHLRRSRERCHAGPEVSQFEACREARTIAFRTAAALPAGLIAMTANPMSGGDGFLHGRPLCLQSNELLVERGVSDEASAESLQQDLLSTGELFQSAFQARERHPRIGIRLRLRTVLSQRLLDVTVADDPFDDGIPKSIVDRFRANHRKSAGLPHRFGDAGGVSRRSRSDVSCPGESSSFRSMHSRSVRRTANRSRSPAGGTYEDYGVARAGQHVVGPHQRARKERRSLAAEQECSAPSPCPRPTIRDRSGRGRSGVRVREAKHRDAVLPVLLGRQRGTPRA